MEGHPKQGAALCNQGLIAMARPQGQTSDWDSEGRQELSFWHLRSKLFLQTGIRSGKKVDDAVVEPFNHAAVCSGGLLT